MLPIVSNGNGVRIKYRATIQGHGNASQVAAKLWTLGCSFSMMILGRQLAILAARVWRVIQCHPVICIAIYTFWVELFHAYVYTRI